MSRPLRIQIAGGFYHVMNRGLAKARIIGDDRDRRLFFATVFEAVDEHDIRVHAYSLLDNHFHLLIETPRPNLSQAMRHIDGVYTQRFNRRHERDGPLLRGRYKAILIESNTYLLQLVRYIHLNPVTSGIVSHAATHRWTSHRAYMDDGFRPSWLTTETALDLLARNSTEAREILERFIGQGVPEKLRRRLDSSNWPSILGSKGFRERTRQHVPSLDRIEVPQIQEWEGCLSWEEILTVIAPIYGVSHEEIHQPQRGHAKRPREAAVLLARIAGGMNLRQIGEALGIRPSSAARIYAHAREKQKTSGTFDCALRAALVRVKRET